MNLLKINALQNSKVILLLLLCFLSNAGKACDICGCFMGITPYDNQSNIGLLYRFRSFNGYSGQQRNFFPKGSSFFFPKDNLSPVPDHNGNPRDYEVYRTLELRGRYFVHRRIEFNFILPYNSNSEQYNNQTSTVSGLVDVNLFAGYHLIRKLNSEGLSQRLIVGAGIKLPSGTYDAKDRVGIRYSTLHQTGTGSTDGFFYANYLLGYRNMGISLNSSYKFNGENKFNEGISNSTTQFLNAFYTVSINKNIKAVPSLQAFYEYSPGETYLGKETGEHKTNNLMAGAGLDIFIKNITLNTGVQFNAYNAATDHPQSAGKLHVGITYNFNQLYYLFN